MIADAIKQARSEHVVYFLLTSYVDARAGRDLPNEIKRLRISGENDVDDMLRALHQSAKRTGETPPVVAEAVRVFSAAAEHLVWLNRLPPADLATRERVFGAKE